MDFLIILLVALGLAMDCFAVSISAGMRAKAVNMKNVFTIAFFFGVFQAIMPVAGWLAGTGLREFITGIDHWIAFSLLTGIGAKMIYESFKLRSEKKEVKILTISILLLLSLATSIDALAVGLSFAFLRISIITPITVIGIVTFILSLLGVYLGKKIGHFFERWVEIVGGLILIGIGTKILFEHLGIIFN